MEKLEKPKGANETDFSNLIDLSNVSRIYLTLDGIYRIKQRRKLYGAAVGKIAICAPSLLAYGFGRMYQRILEEPDIHIELFRTREEAARWLGVGELATETSIIH